MRPQSSSSYFVSRGLVEERQTIAGALADLGGSFGPGAPLLHGIRILEEEWVDRLPTPQQDALPPYPTAAMRELFVASGMSEEEATQRAEREAARTIDDLVEDFHRSIGLPPEMAQEMTAASRRERKWLAAQDATRAGEFEDAARRRDGELRIQLPVIAKAAEFAAREVATLVVSPGRAMEVRDGAVSDLLRSTGRALLAGHPKGDKAPLGGLRPLRAMVNPAEEADLSRWDEAAMAAGELANAMAEGRTSIPDDIAKAAKAVAAIAPEARALSARKELERGRPAKAALDAAEVLRQQGVGWSEIAKVLDRRGLRLEPHTPENIRKSVLARRRRRGKTPATK